MKPFLWWFISHRMQENCEGHRILWCYILQNYFWPDMSEIGSRHPTWHLPEWPTLWNGENGTGRYETSCTHSLAPHPNNIQWCTFVELQVSFNFYFSELLQESRQQTRRSLVLHHGSQQEMGILCCSIVLRYKLAPSKVTSQSNQIWLM